MVVYFRKGPFFEILDRLSKIQEKLPKMGLNLVNIPCDEIYFSYLVVLNSENNRGRDFKFLPHIN